MEAFQARVRLVRTRDGQTLAIPPALELSGDEAVLRRDGGRLVVEPIRSNSLLDVLAGLDTVDDEWPEIDDPPPDTVRL